MARLLHYNYPRPWRTPQWHPDEGENMSFRVCSLVLVLILASPFAAIADLPDPQIIVDRMIEAAGGEAFAELGAIEFKVHEEQTRNDGTQTTTEYTLVADTRNLANLRIEYPGGAVIGCSATGGWAVTEGVMDDRPQTPGKVCKILNQTVFPLLMPFSLEMDGVWVDEVRESTLEGRAVWLLTIPFSKGFFLSPILTTTWLMVVAQDDYSILGYEFIPPVEYRKVSPVGVRYRIIKTREIDGAEIADQILSVGISPEGEESGLVRVTRSNPSIRRWEPALFLSPAQLEALEEDE
jgi:hypothetical protein